MVRGRYKAILIEPDAYLLNVSRYIHLNPIAAGLIESALDYRWSSYGCVCRGRMGAGRATYGFYSGYDRARPQAGMLSKFRGDRY